VPRANRVRGVVGIREEERRVIEPYRMVLIDIGQGGGGVAGR